MKPNRVSGISIHALREEGDRKQYTRGKDENGISIHALREEGDPTNLKRFGRVSHFYPRPPRGGRRRSTFKRDQKILNFYPRPPRGGRHAHTMRAVHTMPFLSTPSARRATRSAPGPARRYSISIHALREEGDLMWTGSPSQCLHFYPRPPRGGRRDSRSNHTRAACISIHALREEGDPSTAQRARARWISIHALREEGDGRTESPLVLPAYFYPRPPRGGRHNDAVHKPHKNDFYPRPPRGGRRIDDAQGLDTVIISIHALREEGDRIHIVCAYITF